jgi:hypothetical protein
MKFRVFLTAWLLIATLSLSAKAQTGPLMWTSFIEVVGNYVRSRSEGTFVSRFTPGVAVTVTRIQLQAAEGSYLFPQGGKCNPVPRVRVTDGSTSYSVAIPNAREVGRHPMSVHADSGPIAVSFPADANLVLRVIPGQDFCQAGSINVTVQYTVN